MNIWTFNDLDQLIKRLDHEIFGERMPRLELITADHDFEDVWINVDWSHEPTEKEKQVVQNIVSASLKRDGCEELPFKHNV